MGKKTTKVRKAWKQINQIIPMGDEVLDMQPNEIYSVLKLTKGIGHLNYEWGIIIINKDGSIVRNYNINEVDGWDANPVRIRSTWKLFKADKVSMQLALMYARTLSVSKQNREFIDKIKSLTDYIGKHWWRRI